MRDILWAGAIIGAVSYGLMNADAISRFVGIFRAVGPGFGW